MNLNLEKEKKVSTSSKRENGKDSEQTKNNRQIKKY